LVYPYSTVTE